MTLTIKYAEKLETLDKSIINILTSKEMLEIIVLYDINPNKWLRLRKSGDEVTLTIKHIIDKNTKSLQYNIDCVKELKIKVDSLELTKMILNNLGFYYRNYQEKKRVSYRLRGMKVELDFWPMIPPYLEIEGDSSDQIINLAHDLEFSDDDIKIMNTDAVYQLYGLNIYDYRELKFEKSI